MIKRYPKEYFVRRTERFIQRRLKRDRYSRQNVVRLDFARPRVRVKRTNKYHKLYTMFKRPWEPYN